MRWLVQQLGVTVPSKLGRCLFCMRSAAFSAFGFWLCAVVAYALGSDAASLGLGTIGTLLTLLWLAHLGAFAERTTRQARSPKQRNIDPVNLERRDFFSTFARAFGAAALFTTLPTGFAAATGTMKQCTYTYYCLGQNGEKPCCDEDTPYLCHNDCSCYAEVPEDCNSYSKCADDC